MVTPLRTPNRYDINIIPDKFNTGCPNQSQLTKMVEPGPLNGIEYKVCCGNQKIAFDLYYSNKKLGDTIIIENIDFSFMPFTTLNEAPVVSPKTVIFRNCNFSSFTTGREPCQIRYYFEYCSFNSFYGSNSTFDHCYFGGSYYDGVVPFVNVSLNNCYISNLSHFLSDGEIHTDAVQIYGYDGLDATNIHFNNCRIEAPAIPIANSKSSVNACFMVQLEYSNAHDITFDNCIINGGGFSIYAWDKDKDLTLTNINFSNIKIGNAHMYGNIYPRVSNGVTFTNVIDTNHLYIGSVWKDSENNVHLSVTNDTNNDRKLIVITDNTQYEFTVPRCPNSKTLLPNQLLYSDFPFDLDYNLQKDAQWLVCYDTSVLEQNQIRFCNWEINTVYIPTESLIDSGMCGPNISFILYENGKLVLSGTGSTFNYNSIKCAPWYENREKIKNVIINAGITILGEQLFRNCNNLSHVQLPDTLTTIGSNCFITCSSLREIHLPGSITTIEKYAFHSTNLVNVYYHGTNNEWQKIFIGINNLPLQNATILYN